MRNSTKYILLIFVIVLSYTICCAQHRTRPMGYIMVFDVAETPLVGANIMLSCKGDTVRGNTVTLANMGSRFAIYESRKQYKDSVNVEVRHIGYKTFTKKYSPFDIQSNIYIFLTESPVEIAEVMVVGEQVAMVIKGDTTFYSAAAFKTMTADRFVEIVKQLPSVELKDGKIYASGAEIKRIYVDNLNLFGQNVGNALTDIEASDVKTIKIYDEGVAAGKIGETRKVMNVSTKSQREVIKGGNIDLLGGVGFQKDYQNKHSIHHSQELTAYRNSDLNSMRIELKNSKNDGTKAVRITPTEHSEIVLDYEHHNGDSISSGSFVILNRNKNSQTTRSYTDYFPTADYNKWIYDDFSKIAERTQTIEIGNMTDIIGKRNAISFDVQSSLTGIKYVDNNRSLQIIDVDRTETNLHNNSKTKNVTLGGSITYTRTLSKRSMLRVSASDNYSSNNSNGWQVDTVASVKGLQMFLNNDINGRNNMFSALANFERKINNKWSYEIGYKYIKNNSKSRQISLDQLDYVRLDSVNSYNYIVNSSRNILTTCMAYNKGKIKGRLNLDGLIYSTAREDHFFGESINPLRFYLLNPSLSLSMGNAKQSLMLTSSLSPKDLSVENLRNSLDISNQLHVKAGNPNLAPQQNFVTNIFYTVTDSKRAQTIMFKVNGIFGFNYLTPKRVLYLKDTYLPQYNYTMQKGSQLTSMENVNGYHSISASADYSRRIVAIKSTLRFGLIYDNVKSPYFLNETLCKSKRNDLTLNIKLNTGFSTHIRVELNSQTTVGIYTAIDSKRKYINEILDGKVEFRIGERFFANTSTLYQYYDNDTPGAEVQNNVLTNFAAGCTIGPDNKFSLSIGIVDIFNNTNYLKTIFETDYIQTQSSAYLGQYGYLKLGYMF